MYFIVSLCTSKQSLIVEKMERTNSTNTGNSQTVYVRQSDCACDSKTVRATVRLGVQLMGC